MGEVILNIFVYYMLGLIPWGIFLGVYTAWHHDYDPHNFKKKSARLALQTPIWPIAIVFHIVFGILAGTRSLIKMAEIVPSHKPDYKKIEALEVELLWDDEKRELEITQAELKRQLSMAREQLNKEWQYNAKHKLQNHTRGDY